MEPDFSETSRAAAGVVVLGMHRSGTSALAGMLTKAGLFAGKDADLLPAAEDNPTGFFERLDVNGLNDKLLAELGGSWDSPPARQLVAKRAPAWQSKVSALVARIRAEAPGQPFMLKDPRISLLLPAWVPALDELGQPRADLETGSDGGSEVSPVGSAVGPPVLVVVDRNPLEVAMSVRERDRRPLYVALALWQLYCTELLEGLAGRRLWFVRYETLLADPARHAVTLLRELGALREDEAAEAARFVSADQRHQRAAGGRIAGRTRGAREAKAGPSLEQALTGSQLALWHWLEALPEGWVSLDPPVELRAQPSEALAATAEYFALVADRNGLEVAYDEERHKALHFEQATELKEHHIGLIEAELGRARRDLAAQAVLVTDLENRVETLADADEALREELRALREDSRAAATNLISVARRSWSAGRGRDR